MAYGVATVEIEPRTSRFGVLSSTNMPPVQNVLKTLGQKRTESNMYESFSYLLYPFSPCDL